jgi:hypothetical protein
MTGTDDEELESTYGPAAPFSEHKRGESIRYRTAAGAITSGTILWVCAAKDVLTEDGKESKHIPLNYVVEPAKDNNFVDIVFPSDVEEG